MINDLTKNKEEIKQQEEKIWQDVNDYERELSNQLEENKQTDRKIKSLDSQYRRLKSTNFINEVFKISSQDQFGTISGFRLGRIDQLVEPEWDEINTAIGQAAYLMAIIAHRFGYKFENHKINLCGAMSTIQSKTEVAPKANMQRSLKYELFFGVNYGSGSVTEERFNTALCYLLHALYGLITEVKMKFEDLGNQDASSNKEPYPININDNTIAGKSVKYKAVESQNWTLAMKFFLTNLQWLVYRTQLKDIQYQQENVNMDKNNSNFTSAGL